MRSMTTTMIASFLTPNLAAMTHITFQLIKTMDQEIKNNFLTDPPLTIAISSQLAKIASKILKINNLAVDF